MNRIFKNLLSVLLLLVVAISFSQAKMKMLGDRSFQNGDYYLAAEYFEKALEGDPNDDELNFKLGQCYRQFFEYDKAEGYYKKASGSTAYPLASYYYALMLKTNGKYEEAKAEFEKFIGDYSPTGSDDTYGDRALVHYNGCVLALDELKKPIRDYSFVNPGSPVNSSYSDFAAVISENDTSIYVTSSRITSDNDREYGVLGGGYTDNYHFHMDSTGWKYDEQGNDEKFKRLNSEYNDGAGFINDAHDKYYLTICKEFNKDRTDVNCAIYVSAYNEGIWEKPEKLNDNINPDNSWNAQPSLTTTGDTMFFVSKREGGYGMHDIWMSVRTGEEENWGEAINLGDKVNTPDIDFSPSYYAEEQVLFFASDGHEGFGGQDIFLARGEDLSDVRNVGLPFNSNRDDFYFVLGEEKGYLSSNREGGSGNDDIYYFNIRSRETIIAELLTDSIEDGLITIKGRILDNDGNPAPGVGILLLNKTTGEVLKRTETDEDGVFIFANLDPSIEYKILLEEEDPSLTTLIDYQLDNVTIERSANDEVVSVDMTDETTEDTETIDDDSESVEEANEPVLSLGRAIFENIYFDFNKSRLKPNSKKVLKEIAEYAIDHPGVRIEVQGFTDSKGSDSYNIVLGKKRAKAAFDFLVKKGVPRSALITSSLGEGDPVASNDNEIGRQLNRRVQFSITGGTSYDSKTMAYVLEPRTTLDDVAELFEMSKDELTELNGDLNTSAYSVVRVRRLDDNAVISSLSLAKADVPAVGMSTSGVPDMTATTNVSSSGEYFSFDDHPNNMGVKYKKYDGSGYYIVLPRNTLFSIARVTGTSVETIKSMNNISGNNIYPGQRLKISADASPISSEDNLVDSYNTLADAGVTVQDQHGEVIMVGDSKRYIVKEGDTFWTICQSFGLSLEELRELNGKSDYVVRPGMPLKISREDN